MKIWCRDEINDVKDVLLHGGVVALPTDTVFGLACVFDIPEAIEKVYHIKSRDRRKALPMMCLKPMINDVAYINEEARVFIDSFMPGALTIVFRKKPCVLSYVTSGLDTIGIRVPDDEWLLDLIRAVGKPILVTSANISNEPSLFKWEDVRDKLGEDIDGLLADDACSSVASTIVDCSGNHFKLLRVGTISEEDLVSVLEVHND